MINLFNPIRRDYRRAERQRHTALESESLVRTQQIEEIKKNFSSHFGTEDIVRIRHDLERRRNELRYRFVRVGERRTQQEGEFL